MNKFFVYNMRSESNEKLSERFLINLHTVWIYRTYYGSSLDVSLFLFICPSPLSFFPHFCLAMNSIELIVMLDAIIYFALITCLGLPGTVKYQSGCMPCKRESSDTISGSTHRPNLQP